MSRIKKEVQEAAEDLHRAGQIDDESLRELCDLTATFIACGRSGSLERFEGKAFDITCREFVGTVDALSGQQCRSCGEIFFDPESAERYAAAGDDLVRRTRVRTIVEALSMPGLSDTDPLTDDEADDDQL